MDVERIIDFITQHGIEYAIRALGAIVIFVVGRWLVKRASALMNRLFQRRGVDPTLGDFIIRLLDILLMVVVALAALQNLGVDTTSFIAILGAAGLAVGLALQGTLGNIGSGVVLILFRPFKVGDFVTIGGESGTVRAITLFNTEILTPDNKAILLPNSAVAAGNIVNYSAMPTRRVDLVFGIGYDDDLKRAKEVLARIIAADSRILADPEPFIGVGELGESSVNLTVRVWVDSVDYWPVYFDLLEKVKLTFDEEGISIPYPQMDVHLDK